MKDVCFACVDSILVNLHNCVSKLQSWHISVRIGLVWSFPNFSKHKSLCYRIRLHWGSGLVGKQTRFKCDPVYRCNTQSSKLTRTVRGWSPFPSPGQLHPRPVTLVSDSVLSSLPPLGECEFPPVCNLGVATCPPTKTARDHVLTWSHGFLSPFRGLPCRRWIDVFLVLFEFLFEFFEHVLVHVSLTLGVRNLHQVCIMLFSRSINPPFITSVISDAASSGTLGTVPREREKQRIFFFSVSLSLCLSLSLSFPVHTVWVFFSSIHQRKLWRITQKRCCVGMSDNNPHLNFGFLSDPLRLHQRDHRWHTSMSHGNRWRGVSSKLSLNSRFVFVWSSFSTDFWSGWVHDTRDLVRELLEYG